MKKHTENYKKSLGKHTVDKGLFLKMYKLVTLPAGKKNKTTEKNTDQNWANDLSRYFCKEHRKLTQCLQKWG